MIKRLLCLLLSLLIVLFAVGCKSEKKTAKKSEGKTQSGETQKVSETISLLFCNSDTLNPYTAATDINRQLCRLVFEPLVKTDNEFDAKYCLAQSVKVEGTQCTAVLKSALFSDKTALSATDVVYSFNLAKASASSYAYKLYNVLSAEALDNSTVKFTLSKSDPYCENVLDFPILKTDSDKRTDSDGVILPAIGCGRYVAADDYSKLKLNENYYGKKGSIKTIKLENAPDAESVSHYIEIGAADIYYTDLSDGNIIRMTAQKYDINLNNLVFLGINSSYEPLKNTTIRYAISSALNRGDICSKAYYNNAIAATGFFNPLFKDTASVQNIQSEANLQITVENLSKIGYNTLDEQGFYVNSSGNRLNLTLLVNSENTIRVLAANEIALQLKNAGINITVIQKSYDAYLESLKTGNFQLYLGEVNITPNMDMSSLVTSNSSASFGVAPYETPKADNADLQEQSADGSQSNLPITEQPSIKLKSLEVINGFYSGVNTISDVATVLQTELPMIPVCYRTGVLFCDEKIKNVENSSVSDIYFSIESYAIK